MALSPNEVSRLYRVGLDNLRTALSSDLEARFATLNPDDLDASFAAFLEENEARIVAAKETAQDLAAAYLEMLAEAQGASFEPLPADPSLATTTEAGSIADGLAAVVPMVKSSIGDGKPPLEAIAFGAGIVRKFVDNEMTRTADLETRRQSGATSSITGWEGVVQGGSCDRCERNRGVHPLGAPFYRHPGCNCERRPVFTKEAQ